MRVAALLLSSPQDESRKDVMSHGEKHRCVSISSHLHVHIAFEPTCTCTMNVVPLHVACVVQMMPYMYQSVIIDKGMSGILFASLLKLYNIL